ncbi:MAG: acyl-CoA dehydrogenase family protein [Gammaproteobacteria bacterium]
MSSARFDAQEFRSEVREFCRTHLPPDLAAKARDYTYFTKEDRVRWQRVLHERGWFAGHWPREFGGQGWGPTQRFIAIEELEYAGTPWLTHFGVSFAGPLLYSFGTTQQRQRFLPGILDSTAWWCQGFSEPSAGSDLASARTRARREGEYYIVDGQKTWATMAQWADMMFALVRTSDAQPKQRGLSILLIDLQSPGVTVRPIPTIDARAHVNDVFLDQVRVPAANLVGSEGQGWECVRYIVNNERLLVTELGKARRYFETLVKSGSTDDLLGRRLRASRSFARHVAELEVRLECLRALAGEAMAAAEGGRPAGVDASVLKIRGSQMQQALLEALVDALGMQGLPAPSDGVGHHHTVLAGMLADHLYARASSIYGGSNEIQANIIARSLVAA